MVPQFASQTATLIQQIMEAQEDTTKMFTDGSSLEDQRKLQVESLTKNPKACKCCEYYGTSCRQNNSSMNEAMRSQDQRMISGQNEETTLQGYAHVESLLSKAHLLWLKEENAQPRKKKRTRPGRIAHCVSRWMDYYLHVLWPQHLPEIRKARKHRGRINIVSRRHSASTHNFWRHLKEVQDASPHLLQM